MWTTSNSILNARPVMSMATSQNISLKPNRDSHRLERRNNGILKRKIGDLARRNLNNPWKKPHPRMSLVNRLPFPQVR